MRWDDMRWDEMITWRFLLVSTNTISVDFFLVLGMTLICIHLFIVTCSFLYWCVMRPASQHFFINSCIYLRILIISYLAMFLGSNSLSVLMCRKAINQSTSFGLASSCCWVPTSKHGQSQWTTTLRSFSLWWGTWRLQTYEVHCTSLSLTIMT